MSLSSWSVEVDGVGCKGREVQIQAIYTLSRADAAANELSFDRSSARAMKDDESQR